MDEKVLVFRNYEPFNEELKKNKLPNVKPQLFSDELKDYVAEMEKEIELEALDLNVIAPKKTHLDLKKHVATSLDFLQKKTNQEIINYIYEFKTNNQDVNLSELVSQHASQNQ